MQAVVFSQRKKVRVITSESMFRGHVVSAGIINKVINVPVCGHGQPKA